MDNNKLASLFSTPGGEYAYNTMLSAIARHNMEDLIKTGVLLGFSGGADSVMLLCLLLRYRECCGTEFPILAVHVNHGIRGDEADRDEAFSREFATALGVDFLSVQVDVPAISEKMGVGTEEAARFVRYSEFEKIISGRTDINAIATAHNATDNTETVLFNMCRGSGANGASGISPVRDNILRPLIYLTKKRIVDALCAVGIPYVTDTTNFSTEYTRNYIRHTILPALARVNPRFELAFSNLSDILREDAEYLDELALGAYNSLLENGTVPRLGLMALPRPLIGRVLMLFASSLGATLTHKHISTIRDLITGDNFVVSVGAGFDFVCERGVCYFRKHDRVEKGCDFYQKLLPGCNKLEGYSAIISIGKNITVSSSNVYKISIQANLSSAIIVGDLYVRFRMPGDAYFYGGMTHKLKKVFNDRDIPPSIRDRIPIICDDAGIVWVPGLGVRDDGIPRGATSDMPIFLGVDEALDGEEVYSACIPNKETK